MSKLVCHTYKLYNNPFVLTQVVLSFYKNCKVSPNNFLLAYLVLPLTLYPPSQAILQRVQSRSRISKITRNKEAIMGLPDRIAEYKQITNLCIQHSINNKLIRISDMQIEVIRNVAYSSPDLQAAIKAANNLSKIFNSYGVVSIYKLLGIKNL
ncbi:three component ABC system middle component [uncultured Alistipes sp.]|uniref:three component ABC system middle component n=1 Tax=uncultured Alistipes sp. TaxID=538949 RepID=UPI00272A300B|nr:three component ABC system middle component [uncultured Alistipes sp.]